MSVPVKNLLAAVAANEIGGQMALAYRLSFAGLGNSGASFGVFQADTNVNPVAREVLRAVLTGAGLAQAATIVQLLSRPCPRNPLSPAETSAVDAALGSAAGKVQVDAMDLRLCDGLVAMVDGSIKAAAGRGLTLDLAAMLYIGLWSNMSGAPNTLNRWLAGAVIEAAGQPIEPPSGPVIGQADLEIYLRRQNFFVQNPRNFDHLQQSVQAGLAV